VAKAGYTFLALEKALLVFAVVVVMIYS